MLGFWNSVFIMFLFTKLHILGLIENVKVKHITQQTQFLRPKTLIRNSRTLRLKWLFYANIILFLGFYLGLMEGIDQITDNTTKIDQKLTEGFGQVQGKHNALTFWFN